MYVEVPRISGKERPRNLGLPWYMYSRNTSALEATFLHLRFCAFSEEIPNVGHPWLWLVDQLADVCTGSDMFPDGSELPVTLRKSTRTNTDLKSCRIRGVDWEVLKTRNLWKSNGVRVSPQTDEDTLKIVLKFPELVKTNDWVRLEKVSGIRTNTFALEAMRQWCTHVSLQCPALQANNLPALKAKLRSTAPDAPRSVLRPPTLSANLGTTGLVPLVQVPGSPCTVMW